MPLKFLSDSLREHEETPFYERPLTNLLRNTTAPFAVDFVRKFL
jgi:hypothetical protein